MIQCVPDCGSSGVGLARSDVPFHRRIQPFQCIAALFPSFHRTRSARAPKSRGVRNSRFERARRRQIVARTGVGRLRCGDQRQLDATISSFFVLIKASLPTLLSTGTDGRLLGAASTHAGALRPGLADPAPSGSGPAAGAPSTAHEGRRKPPPRFGKQGRCVRRTGNFCARTGNFCARTGRFRAVPPAPARPWLLARAPN